jgi:hypothetical protein
MVGAVVAQRRRNSPYREFPCSICNKPGVYLVEKCGLWMVTLIITPKNKMSWTRYKLAGICGRMECFNMILLSSDKFFFN